MGIVTSLCNALLTSLATCLCCEYFPTCCRICAYNIGHSIIMAFFILSICCLGVIIYSIIEVTKEYGDNAFWFTTIYSYILGLFQSWFMIEILSMIWDFHSEWSKAHPQTKEEKETEKKEERKKRGLILTCIIFSCKCILFIMFGWLICIMAICCRKKEKVEGDGQDEFGVNFHEYEQWKQGQPISERPLPRNYDVLGLKKRKSNCERNNFKSTSKNG